MSKIPTAEKVLKKWYNPLHGISEIAELQLIEAMKEFAKLHVKAAIETCIEEAPSGSSTDTVSYKDVVKALKDCYPESNIK